MAFLALLAAACTDYGPVIDGLQQQLEQLEQSRKSLQDNAEALQSLIAALQAEDRLVDFSPITEDGQIIGYKVIFQDAGQVTVYNQKASIGVGHDGGKYYWMEGGQWLTDASGNRVEISSGSPLPIFRVNAGSLEVSVDGGSSYATLGEVDKCLIASVEEDAVQLVFTLSGGAQVTIPKYKALTVSFEGDDRQIGAGETVVVSYSIEGADNASVKVLCGTGWSAAVTAVTATTGTIAITAPTPIAQDEVIVFVSDGSGRMTAVRLALVADESTNPAPPAPETVLQPVQSSFEIPADGGEILVDVYANVDYSVETSAPWLHFMGTKAVREDHLAFFADPNTGFGRSASATLTAGNYSTTVSFLQESIEWYLTLSDSQMSFGAGGGSQVITVSANVEYSIEVSDSWLGVTGGPQAGEATLTVLAQSNDSPDARTATVTFSSSLTESKTLSVSQDGLVPVLEISASKFDFPCEGGDSKLTVTSNVEYTIDVSADWLSVQGEPAIGSSVFTVSAEENTSFDSRTATVTFISPLAGSRTLSVSQDGMAPELEISADSFSFASDGGLGTLTVWSNVEYTLSAPSASWLSVAGDAAVGRSYFTLSAEANPSYSSARSATFTISGAGVPSRTVTVTQQARKPVIPRAAAGTNLYTAPSGSHYRYGPSIIINDDGSIDVWTSKEGGRYLDCTADYLCQENTTRSKVDAHGHVIAQYFNVQHRFMRVMVNLYGTGTTADAVTLKLYKWAGSYASTLAAAPLNTLVINNTTVLYTDGNRYSIYKNDSHSWMEPGEYMWTATDATAGVGVYKFSGAGTIYLTDSKSYLDGSLAGEYNFQARLRGSAYNSNRYADSFAYFHSDNGGVSWSAERDVLFGTEGSEDSWSVCDPGVSCFGGWYYIGYTSAKGEPGVFNHCYLARSRTPMGPWYKWNGSGWGAEPVKVVEFTGGSSDWGIGEPSIVVKDNTIYLYHSYVVGSTRETRVLTAPVSDDWPAHLQPRGTAFVQTGLPGCDSADVKYVEDYGLFYAFHTYNRMTASAKIAVWTSTDGISFVYRGDMGGDFPGGMHNMGVGGDGLGHINLSRQQYVAYAYYGNGNWGNWNTRFAPMYFE